MLERFAVVAPTITNTGPTVVGGAIAGTTVTGFPPGSTEGQRPFKDVEAELTSFWFALRGKQASKDLTGKDLGGMAAQLTDTLTLKPGIYYLSSSAQLTGTLTLQGPGEFIFLIGSTLTTASNAKVVCTQGAKVTWLVGSSATLGTGTSFVGRIIAQISITLTTGVSLVGGAFARTGAVTLDSNQISL